MCNESIKLNGFIHQYGEDDFSIWSVQLSEEDEEAIIQILEKYESQGVSVRGGKEISIGDAF